MVSSNSVEANELLRRACLKREVEDFAGALADLQATGLTEGEPGLVLLAVQARCAEKNGKDAVRHYVDQIEVRYKEIKAVAAIPTMLIFRAMCELGRARAAAQDHELAGQTFRTALGLAQDEFGKDSLEMIYPAICLAMHHEDQSSNLLALALARDAVDNLRHRTTQVKDPSLLLAGLLTISNCAFLEHRYAQALQAAEEALDLVRMHSLSPDTGDRLQKCIIVKMLALNKLDRHQEAKDTGEVFVEKLEAKYGRYSARLLEPLCHMASIYDRLGARSKSAKALDQALVIVSQIVEDRPFENIEHMSDDGIKIETMPFKEYEVLNRLSESYILQGKFVEAFKLYPASMRARYTTYVASSTNIVDMMAKRLKEFDEERQRKQKY